MDNPRPAPAAIRHDETLARFTVEVADQTAYLAYVVRDPGAVEFYRVFVPPAARGQGVAERITRRAFAWAAKQDLTVIPTCSYVRRLAETHLDLAARTRA